MASCRGDLLIEFVEITLLKPYALNARAHSRKQIQRIVESIKQFGFTNPLLVDEVGEIIAGHGRFQAGRFEEPRHLEHFVMLWRSAPGG